MLKSVFHHRHFVLHVRAADGVNNLKAVVIKLGQEKSEFCKAFSVATSTSDKSAINEDSADCGGNRVPLPFP